MIIFNIKIIFRNLWKNNIFSAINIIGLALGMACCLVIALFIWTEWRFDHFHKNLDNIYRITEKQNQAGTFYNVAVTPGPLAPALQKDFPDVLNTVRFGNWSGKLKNGSRISEENNIQLTDNSIFQVFNFPLIVGDPRTALQSPDQIIITEKIADKFFGKAWRNDRSILSQTFRLNNELDFKLAGIAKDPPKNSSILFDVLLPLSYLFNSDKWANNWNSNNFHTYVQLKAGVSVPEFAKKIERRLLNYSTSKDLLLLQPFRDQYLRSFFDFQTDWGKRSNVKYLKIFTGVGILLLIIACMNFINLSTARSLKRSMEVGIRKVNGASRHQLIMQFLGESLLFACMAGVLAIVMVQAAAPFLTLLTGDIFSASTSRFAYLPFLSLFILAIGLLAGLYPAFILSSYNPAKVFKKPVVLQQGNLLRQSLVVCQFAISVTLIICTFFMYRQLRFIQDKDLGFDKEQVINMRLGGQLSEKSVLFNQDLQNIPGIAATAPATISLVNVENSSFMEWEGMQPADKFLITQANIDPGFIPALGMKLVSGSNFSRQRSNDTVNYIVNETAVRRMGYTAANAVGRQVTFWGAKGFIIGVVKDFHFKPLNTAIDPFIFRYQPQDRYFNMFVKIQSGKTQEVISQLEKVYKKYETETPLQFGFLGEAIDDSYREDKQTAAIILLFAGLTIFVGCLGLFGLSVFSAEQRVREIGIRKVLGAGVMSIAAMLSRDFIKLVFSAVIIAVPVAWYLANRWVESYAYRIHINWWVFVITGVGVTGIAFLTVSIQAVKAASANPVDSLRSE